MGERPVCKCHDKPMRKHGMRAGVQAWICKTKHDAANARYVKTPAGRAGIARHYAKTNPRRIRLGNTYLGTTNQFPAPREAVIDFVKSLRKESRLWPA